MNEKYYLISCTSDGTRIRQMTKEEIQKYLSSEDFEGKEALDSIPSSDPNYWGEDKVLVIKGQIVTPRPTKILYDID